MSRIITPVPTAKVDALVLELQGIGDRLEANGLAHWLTVARAAFILAGIRHDFTNAAELGGINVERLVIDLQALGDRFEARGNPDYQLVNAAASLIEGVRLGITVIADDALPENWFNPDPTGRGYRHNQYLVAPHVGP